MNPKTDLPCDCGIIAYMMSEPDSPVSIYKNGLVINDGWPIYFCPSCGGKLPDSSKPIYVPYVTPEERARLEALVEGISSPEEAIARLGTPDYDELMRTYYAEGDSMPTMFSSADGKIPAGLILDESVVPTRNVEFYNLSKTANIEFYFTEGQPLVQPLWRTITPKGLPPRHLEEGEIV